MKRIYWWIVIIWIMAGCVFYSCGNGHPRLQEALSMAGENRRELEKVIKHYSVHEADTQKLRAACFLIENMPWHYSFQGDGILQYYAETDSVNALPVSVESKIDAFVALTQKYADLYDHIQKDVSCVSADYLIYSIDRAFEDWKDKPWAAILTFDQFCEFLLPYKCTEFQQLDYWRDSLGVRYDSILTTYVVHSDEGRNNTLEAAHTVQTEFKIKFPIHLLDQTKENKPTYPLLSAHNIDKLPFGLCYEYCVTTVAALRSQGIPGVIDYVPHWGRKWLGHDWVVTLSKWGTEIPYDGIIGSWPADRFWPINEPKPKVFRRTYAVNPDVLTYLMYSAYQVPSVSNVFRTDVTDHYGKTTDIPVEVLSSPNKELMDRFVYLSVFNMKGWTPVEVKKLEGRRALFENMGRDIVYMPQGYNGKRLIPVAYPVLAKLDGSLVRLEPDTVHTRPVRLTRKYYKDNNCLLMESRVFQGKVQGANHADFSDAETFCQIDSLGYIPYLMSFTNDKAYRYWRFIAHESRPCNIAELRFYRRQDSVASYGKIITRNEGSFGNNPALSPDKAFDGNALTCYDPPLIPGVAGGSWIGMDFGQPVCIDRATVIPRSDDNAIAPGDEYELKYWSEKGWRSLGKQI
ncbi:MAG: hypothetical protein IJC16_07990, partial [Rikenellaceae bacterium]|nr:hypothetical protein [Rikenellaceae bacterium]